MPRDRTRPLPTTIDELVARLDESTRCWAWLGSLYRRRPLGLRLHGALVEKFELFGLARCIGTARRRHTITELGERVWENHRPEVRG